MLCLLETILSRSFCLILACSMSPFWFLVEKATTHTHSHRVPPCTVFPWAQSRHRRSTPCWVPPSSPGLPWRCCRTYRWGSCSLLHLRPAHLHLIHTHKTVRDLHLPSTDTDPHTQSSEGSSSAQHTDTGPHTQSSERSQSAQHTHT